MTKKTQHMLKTLFIISTVLYSSHCLAGGNFSKPKPVIEKDEDKPTHMLEARSKIIPLKDADGFLAAATALREMMEEEEKESKQDTKRGLQIAADYLLPSAVKPEDKNWLVDKGLKLLFSDSKR